MAGVPWAIKLAPNILKINIYIFAELYTYKQSYNVNISNNEC